MTNEHKGFCYHGEWDDVYTPTSAPAASYSTTQQGFDPSSYMNFSECLHGSMDYNSLTRAFAFFPSSSEVEGKPGAVQVGELGGGDVGGNSETNVPVTPNSSVSLSSSEAGGTTDSEKLKKEHEAKESEDGGEPSKKLNKGKNKKGEKRRRDPRFAFMTKSEVDHLEDGYRWRKYGQKAVKNSPYPRSYYRCTTQKCTVKKRVERSFQEPSIVITTYEGQHNHPIPATLRGNAVTMFSHSMSTPNHLGSSQGFLVHQMPPMSNLVIGSGYTYPPYVNQCQIPDYGLLQDIIPSMILKQEP
ncbi:hypothetical protein K2173_001333 [Erythroxylum novogranatense]|uniref:WRKY domain-containing protein n=1 Tax=Erythroxylum novogranatense TaxID=1862640 RepID=A0AAV8T3D9_9ROSI|nr:hypothetical protein K2173_001333 [Erythroxylum novogranatense]